MARRTKYAKGSTARNAGPSAEKAGQMLRENRAQGQTLTSKQKRLFGWIRGGRKPRKG